MLVASYLKEIGAQKWENTCRQALDIGATYGQLELVALDALEGVNGDGVNGAGDLQLLQLRPERAENLVGQNSGTLQNSRRQSSERSQTGNDAAQPELVLLDRGPALKQDVRGSITAQNGGNVFIKSAVSPKSSLYTRSELL